MNIVETIKVASLWMFAVSMAVAVVSDALAKDLSWSDLSSTKTLFSESEFSIVGKGPAGFASTNVEVEMSDTIGKYIMVSKKITQETPKLLDKALSYFNPGEKITIVLHSGGGDFLSGLEMGRKIRSLDATTIATRCASACAMMWTAGTTRLVLTKSKVGLHSAYKLVQWGLKKVSYKRGDRRIYSWVPNMVAECAEHLKPVSRTYFVEMLGATIGNNVSNINEKKCGKALTTLNPAQLRAVNLIK